MAARFRGHLARTPFATHLADASPDGGYGIGFPDARETMHGEPVNPASTLPWLTPWRFNAIGSLKTIAESTLGTDLADKPAVTLPVGAVRPGKAAWSWPLLGDSSANYDTSKQFIDYAADMGWTYCLIDAWWDKQIGYDKMKELADYAKTKHVGILLWYNSNGNWNGAPQTPKNMLLTREARVQEFTRLKAMGIKGLKVDFFGGDGQQQDQSPHHQCVRVGPLGRLHLGHSALRGNPLRHGQDARLCEDFMKQVPSVWDDTKFIDGYPGKFVVIARKGDDRWFIAGINGEPVAKTVTLDLRELPAATSGRLITDDESSSFTEETVTLTPDRKLTVTLKPNGGVVLVLPVQ